MLGLLLLVSLISAYDIQPLPQQLRSLEAQHMIQVENQLLRLQSVVLAEAQVPNLHLALSSPVTLGSQAIPPWGGPSPGSIGPEGSLSGLASNYTLAKVVPAPPRWNNGTSCLTGGAGHCSGNGAVDTWNITNTNNTSLTIKVTGNHNSLGYNITGNNDTITVQWTGGDTGFVLFIINGSDDHIIYQKGGSDVTAPTATFLFYGQRDVFDFAPSGSHSGHGSMTLNVVFVGSVGLVCPYGNLSATDSLGSLGAGGSNLNMSVTWWNAVGYVSPPHTVPYPGGGSNENLTFQNRSGVVACAFTREYASNYPISYGAGILVRMLNTYGPAADVAYDQGAVIAAADGSSATMVSPPPLTVSLAPQGLIAALTLVNVIGSSGTSSGFATAAVTTTLVTVASFTLVNGQTSRYIASPLYLHITTAFPSAWAAYFAGQHAVFPGGVSCHSAVTLSAPFSCLHPPVGTSTTLSVGLAVQGLTVTTITVSVQIL
jgi:hypothetical protein